MTEPTPQPLAPEATNPHADPPEASGAVPRRFLLGRLAGAVRRQDWFTVLVEITIVVLGVVIGFQVTAWGQSRSDAAKERAYLVQLEGDMRETLRSVSEAETETTPRVRAGGRLVRAYRMPEPPPEDSLLTWTAALFNLTTLDPVVSTAEALVATGDLALIRDDSLRAAIPAYLSQMRKALAHQTQMSAGLADSFVESTQFLDYWELVGGAAPQAMIDSLAQADDSFGLPAGTRTRPFPLRMTDLLGDREAYRTIYLASVWQMNLRNLQGKMREDAERLLALIDSARGDRSSGPLAADTTARRP